VVGARDHDAVGAGHAAHPGQLGRAVGPGQNLENGLTIHPVRIASDRPPGKCRAAQSFVS
jgi:hypothetical protein